MIHPPIDPPPPGRPILTVDLEEWFHLLDCDAIPEACRWKDAESRIEGNTDRLLEIFAERGLQATFFVLGWVADHHPGLLRRLVSQGHEIGCHSHMHTLVHQQTPSAFREETRQALEAISQCISAPVTSYRAPGFSLSLETPWAFDHLAELGITTDCSLFPGRHAHGGVSGGIPRSPFVIRTPSGEALREFPMTTTRLGPFDVAFAGGGYFRLLPLCLIQWLTRRHPMAMTYFHPRDFDDGQPRLANLSLMRRFKAYAGIQGASAKLEKFLDVFGADSVAQASLKVAWASAPYVSILDR